MRLTLNPTLSLGMVLDEVELQGLRKWKGFGGCDLGDLDGGREVGVDGLRRALYVIRDIVISVYCRMVGSTVRVASGFK